MIKKISFWKWLGLQIVHSPKQIRKVMKEYPEIALITYTGIFALGMFLVVPIFAFNLLPSVGLIPFMIIWCAIWILADAHVMYRISQDDC